jgi:transmembrane sensor
LKDINRRPKFKSRNQITIKMEEKNVTPLSSEERKDIWNNVFSEIRQQERKKRRRKRGILATATIVLLLLSTWTYHSFFEPDVYLAESERFEVMLRDGTRVILSQGGKLTVEKSFPSDTREVFLEGDALFNVAKSKLHPFIVHGNGYETKVLGTVFKVSQSDKTFKVDLFEGKVLVYKTGRPKDPTPLAPKQTFTNYGISEATSVSETRDKKNNPSSDKPASLTFTNCPINGAVQVIEKTYGIKVQYPRELENQKITISFSNVKAEAYIQSLAAQFNLKIKQNDSIFELEK